MSNELAPIKKAHLSTLTEEELPSEWKISDRGKEAIKIAASQRQLRHGLFASVPIVCKGIECAYAETCGILEMDLAPVGERCPLEIAHACDLYHMMCKELQIDEESIIDLQLIKELIDIEVVMERCDRTLAKDGDIMSSVTIGATVRGEAIISTEIHKAFDLKDKLARRKHEVLRLLNSTRKDKAQEDQGFIDPSTYASQMLAKAREIALRDTIVVEYEEEKVSAIEQ